MKKWILLLLFSSSAAMADINIKADISPDIVRPGDPLEYEVTIVASGKDSADDVAIPKFPGFQELGQSPSTSHVVSFVNGHMQSQTTKRIVVSLQAEKEGTFTIPATTVTSGGKTYRSEPITVKVDRKAMPQAQPRGGGPTTDPFDDPFSQDEDMARAHQMAQHGDQSPLVQSHGHPHLPRRVP
jgi:hypothetical protein